MSVQNIDRTSVEWTNFSKFVDFTRQEGVKNDSVARFECKNASENDFRLKRSTSDRIHNFLRSEDARNANNQVRTQFSNAVCRLFGIVDGDVNRLPPEVKKAMLLDDYGKGKPLSARRIKAVSAAIENWDACPVRFMVPKNVQNQYLMDIQGELDKVCGKDDEYQHALEQIVNDVNRTSSDNARLSPEEEKKFQADPNARYAGKSCAQGYMLNGKQYPLDPIKNTVTTLSVEEFIQEQFPVDKNDLNAVKLRKAVALFSHQGSFTLGSEDINPSGKILGDKTRSACHVVNIVRSSDRKSYDIILQQKFFDVPGLDTEKGPLPSPTVLFDPMRPGEYSVTTTCRLSMKRGRPVVSYVKKPEVQTKFFKPVSVDVFKDRTVEFAQTHLDEILSRTLPSTQELWNGLKREDQDGILKKICGAVCGNSLDGGAPVNINAFASKFNQWAVNNKQHK